MNIQKELNLVELAAKMAETMLINIAEQNNLKESDIIRFLEKNEISYYTDEAQNLYNKYYDSIYEFLENQGFKNKK